MKFINYKWFSFLAIVAVLATSCSKFEEMNIDPNTPKTVPTSGLLTQAQANLVYNFNGELAQLGSQYVQHFTQLEYTYKSNYDEGEGRSSFYSAYLGGLTDLQEIIRLNEDEATKSDAGKFGDNENQIAVAKILQTWAFHNITDVWGDVPYTDALRGSDDIIAPKYDTQEDIYDGLIAELDAAIAMINPSALSDLQGDLIFDGDMNMWKAFAESLRLRIAMRLSEVDDTKANSLIDDADFANAFTTSAQYAEFQHLATEDEANPLYIDNVIIGGGDYFATANTLVDAMVALNDPRLPAYANLAANSGTYVGLEIGVTGDANDYSLPGDMYAEETAPTVILVTAEILFIKAEAAQRGYIGGSAAQFYNDAITASMEYNGVDAAAIATYIAQPEVAYNATNWRELIGTQKWLALYAQGINAWAEWRRLDYPVLTPGAFAVLTEIPRRRAYPSDEYATNNANVMSAAANIPGGDKFTEKVWWDK
ncbi:MAG: SusD/RagB family nutrient-binding outer membrane lipoprotein [Bacteroidales bacterium]|nr:SusD/RagB family nutrient-binding outer membrane lipoprotein [Bacteroidales bacterium]